MDLRHLVVATDQTEAARAAEQAALGLVERTGARVSAVFVTSALVQRPVDVGAEVAPLATQEPALDPEHEQLRSWWDAGHRPASPDTAGQPVNCVVTVGLPSVEISRFAEDHEADLIVMTRKRHSRLRRMLLGDTADSVVRRSPVPCLFVPVDGFDGSRILAAVDGTERGFAVAQAALGFAAAIGGELSFVTVEPAREDEPKALAGTVLGGRSILLAQGLDRIGLEQSAVVRQVIPGGNPRSVLRVRRGGPVAEILQEVADANAGVLVIGYHRGGPPGPLESGSVARQLAHRAPCAVLTIPL